MILRISLFGLLCLFVFSVSRFSTSKFRDDLGVLTLFLKTCFRPSTSLSFSYKLNGSIVPDIDWTFDCYLFGIFALLPCNWLASLMKRVF